MSPTIEPLLNLGGAVLSAIVGSLFAGGDIALTSLSSTRLAALVEQSEGKTRKAFLRIQAQDEKLRSRYLLGRVVSTALTAALLFRAALLFEFSHPFLFALVGTMLLTGTCFEISTTLGHQFADRVAPLAAQFLRPLELMVLPLSIPLGAIGSLFRRRTEPTPDPRITEAEVEMMVEEVERSGGAGPERAEMIRNVLEFADLTAKDIMIPRTKVEAIDIAMPLNDVLKFVKESGHSRYPVYRDEFDNVIGVLHAKDLFKVLEEGSRAKVKLADLMRSPANFVPESSSLTALLREMRARRQHLAVVVDEYGVVSGVVSLEDVLEEIVGDIRDEHDPETEEAPIQDLGDGRVVADADVLMGELNDVLGGDIPLESKDDSVGGMLMQHLGKIPEAGTMVNRFGLQFIVRDSDEKHISKVEVTRPVSTSVSLSEV